MDKKNSASRPTIGIVTTLWSYYDFLPGWCESIVGLHRQPDKVIIAAHDAQKTLDIAQQTLDNVSAVQVDEDFSFALYLNKAIEQCHTDWIVWIGVDDRYRPYALTPIDTASSDIIAFGMKYGDGREWIYNGDFHLCYHHNPVTCGSPFRRWIWEAIPFQPQVAPFEDWAFWGSAYKLGATIQGTGRFDFDYACHPSQIEPPFAPNAAKVRAWMDSFNQR